MRIFISIVLAFFALGSAAQAQSGCNGQTFSGYFCGNSSSSSGLPGLVSGTALFDKSFGTTAGTVLSRTTSWGATAQPALGANGGTGGAITLNGSTSGSITVGARAAAGTGTVFNLPSTNGALNNVLITDGAGNTSWTAAGGGTVSSVGLSMPGVFTVTNSPVTSTGTLTVSLGTEAANLIWAGPSTGAASAPTFRSLVGADLPNPSASSLGGVQSFAGTTSQWIRQISTSGVPTASQPAFTDISGVASAAQLPNPTATTLGGVESYVAVSNQWINTISTSGVPSSSQPGFVNLAGQASLSQLPGIGSNSILSNITGGTSTPLANSLSAIIDSSAGSAQGDVLYRGASSWVVLAPGTSGQVFTTGGAAANPTWTSVTGTGTVTSVATNNGLTGGIITSSGTLGLASISTGNVLANVSGSSTYPTPTIPSAVLDVIGSTQGSLLYRGGSVWSALTPGTIGQFLQTTGAGSTPQWASVQLVSPPTAQGRLTGQASTPVMTTTQANITTLRYDCYVGNAVPYFDGAYDQVDTISSCEVTDAMVSAASAGQVVSGNVYDVWWVHGGANRICLAMSASGGGGGGWSSDTGGSNTARGTGYSQLDLVTRSYVTNKNSIVNCFNGSSNYGSVAANQGTYLGTIYASANGQTSFTFAAIGASGGNAGLLGVYNYYNRVIVAAAGGDTGTGYTYTTASWRQTRGTASMQVQYVMGGTSAQDATLMTFSSTISTAGQCAVGIGADTTTGISNGAAAASSSSTATAVTASAIYTGYPGIGLHTMTTNEYGGTSCIPNDGLTPVAGNNYSFRLRM